VQAQAGHASIESTRIYLHSRELQQTGEKPQVTRSALAPNWFWRPVAQAC
jgi:hypothetical protein